MEHDPHSAQSLLKAQIEVPQQHELPRYLDWRKARALQRAAHPCVMTGCGQKVSGNKAYCLACWNRVTSVSVEPQLQEAA